MNTVKDLQHRKRIRGTAPTLEDLLNPIEEDIIGCTGLEFPGGDDEIIAEVTRPTTDSIEDEEVEEVDGLNDPMQPKDALDLCERMGKVCVDYADADGVSLLEIQKQLRRLQAHLRRLDGESYVQTTLDQWVDSSSTRVY